MRPMSQDTKEEVKSAHLGSLTLSQCTTIEMIVKVSKGMLIYDVTYEE